MTAKHEWEALLRSHGIDPDCSYDVRADDGGPLTFIIRDQFGEVQRVVEVPASDVPAPIWLSSHDGSRLVWSPPSVTARP